MVQALYGSLALRTAGLRCEGLTRIVADVWDSPSTGPVTLAGQAFSRLNVLSYDSKLPKRTSCFARFKSSVQVAPRTTPIGVGNRKLKSSLAMLNFSIR